MPGSSATGYLAVGVATFFFGSNFVPVKRYEAHDGMYYQWIMCTAIFMVGLTIQVFLYATTEPPMPANATTILTSGRPDAYSVKFFPLAAVGGALWATGNTLSVPVINLIGLGLGLLVWGAANMLTGWATGMFGLFGTSRDHLADPHLNYIGVALAVIALSLYTQVKTVDQQKVKAGAVASRDAPDVELLDGVGDYSTGEVRTISPGLKALGLLMAVAAGFLFGNNFTPVNYIKDNDYGPDQPLEYVFSHFCGIFAASTFWFVVYCVYMRGRPLINPSITLPGMVSGLMWAVAQTCWFIANDALSVSVAFPTITSGPGIVSALWGVFVFGEIQGTRNIVVLACAVTLTLVGCTLIGLSK